MLMTHKEYIQQCDRDFILLQMDKLLKERMISTPYYEKTKKFIGLVEKCHSDKDMLLASYALLYSLIILDCARYRLSESMHNIDMAPRTLIQFVSKLDMRMLPPHQDGKIKTPAVMENIVSVAVLIAYVYARTAGNTKEAERVLNTPIRFPKKALQVKAANDARVLLNETRMFSRYKYERVVLPFMIGAGINGRTLKRAH